MCKPVLLVPIVLVVVRFPQSRRSSSLSAVLSLVTESSFNEVVLSLVTESKNI